MFSFIMSAGRFDRQIVVGTPDVKAREEILKVHASASNVLPVPGWPTKRTPFGILAPISVNFFGDSNTKEVSIPSIENLMDELTKEERVGQIELSLLI